MLNDKVVPYLLLRLFVHSIPQVNLGRKGPCVSSSFLPRRIHPAHLVLSLSLSTPTPRSWANCVGLSKEHPDVLPLPPQNPHTHTHTFADRFNVGDTTGWVTCGVPYLLFLSHGWQGQTFPHRYLNCKSWWLSAAHYVQYKSYKQTCDTAGSERDVEKEIVFHGIQFYFFFHSTFLLGILTLNCVWNAIFEKKVNLHNFI